MEVGGAVVINWLEPRTHIAKFKKVEFEQICDTHYRLRLNLVKRSEILIFCGHL